MSQRVPFRARSRRAQAELDDALYHYAIHCALAALVRHAAGSGRGWYHFVAGELIVATEVAL